MFYPTNKNCYTGPNSPCPHSCKYLLVSDKTVAESVYSTTPCSVKPNVRVRFAAISILRFISDFYLESTNKQGGAFQNIPYGDNGLRHVMTAEVSQWQLTKGPASPMASPEFLLINSLAMKILFDLKEPHHLRA